MLLRRATLDAIKAGTVDLAFRRWRRPTVKAGGTLKTAVGVLAIESIERTTLKVLSDRDARRAGFTSRRELVESMQGREGSVYRIALAYQGADPRIELRRSSRLSATELEELTDRLARMDHASRVGPWTRDVLRIIDRHPQVVSTELARRLQRDRTWLKPNVRKLKNLGLTISHEVGYSLSPRGKALLKHLEG